MSRRRSRFSHASDGWKKYGLRVSEVRSGMTDTHFNGATPGTPQRAGHLRADEVAQAVAYALTAPPHVRVDEVVLHPVAQPVVF